MAVAVSLLPEILRPATKWIAGEAPESPIKEWLFVPKYDPTKSYMLNMWGGQYWMNGAALNWMDQHFHEEYLKQFDNESPRKVQGNEKQVPNARYNRRRRQ